MSTEQGADAPADYRHVNQSTLSGLLEDALLDPGLGNGDPLVDWSAKLDEIERLAKDVIRAKAQFEDCCFPKHKWHLEATQIDLRNACDPSTVLALVDENRRLRERAELAELLAATTQIALNAAESSERRMREALRVMVTASKKITRDGTECVLCCKPFDVRSGPYWVQQHFAGCSVPAAEAALRTGGDGEAP